MLALLSSRLMEQLLSTLLKTSSTLWATTRNIDLWLTYISYSKLVIYSFGCLGSLVTLHLDLQIVSTRNLSAQGIISLPFYHLYLSQGSCFEYMWLCFFPDSQINQSIDQSSCPIRTFLESSLHKLKALSYLFLFLIS